MHHLNEQLFAALARAAELRRSMFNSQGRVNAAWPLTTANHLDEKLFAACQLIEFKPQELLEALWGAFGVVFGTFFTNLQLELLRRR